MNRSQSRRRFVQQAGLVGIGAAISAASPAWLFAAEEELIPFTDVPADFTTKAGDVVTRMDLRELKSWLTPTDQYFTIQHYNIPKLDASAWRLESAGLIGRTETLTLDELKKRPRIERTVFFECS